MIADSSGMENMEDKNILMARRVAEAVQEAGGRCYKDRLIQLFTEAGCTKLHFDGVEGHLFLVAAVSEKKENKKNEVSEDVFEGK